MPMNRDRARTNMIKQQLRTWNVLDDATLDLLTDTPREQFFAEGDSKLAFADTELPLGRGQWSMSPREEGRLLQALKVRPHEKVLQIGALSGYLTALLAKLAMHVYVIDSYQEFLDRAAERVAALGLQNVSYVQGDVNDGWQADGPFDVIVLTGSVPNIPQVLRESITINGRLYAVVGSEPNMVAMVLQREAEGQWHETKLFETVRPRLPHVKEPSAFIF
ncbi:MAG: protein-L-isoaspartate O-methyltransferase [Pseudomonadota bacterium]|nr:protein-L-isoaspartate O-methyltransferase [Pseudomonadota bacterium]